MGGAGGVNTFFTSGVGGGGGGGVIAGVGGTETLGGVGVEGTGCSNHSPQNLHFFAVAIISSPHSGHFFFSSIIVSQVPLNSRSSV